MSQALALKAPAKLNLALAVGAPVPPRGYHPIASWFVPIEVCDDLTLMALDGGASVYDIMWDDGRAIDWSIEKDLAVRAHGLIERHVGRALPVRLELRKRIPTGGGLGGGSSDAAAMLIGVNRLFELGLAHEVLAEMANRLGSDVAFFLDDRLIDRADDDLMPRPALVTGFGERIERVGSVSTEVVLAFPSFGCPTAEVYRAFDAVPRAGGAGAEDEVFAAAAERVDHAINDAQLGGTIDARLLFNDLLPAACAVAPGLGTLMKEKIGGVLGRVAGRVNPLVCHMTGSGSTLFILVGADPLQQASGAAENLAAELARAVPEVRFVATRIG